MKYDNYVSTRERYGKVSSFALYGGNGHGGDDLLRVESEEQFIERGLDLSLLPQHNGLHVVMYALNFSQANGGRDEADEDFASFHMTRNDSKLGALVGEAPILRGAYITDLFKNYAESKASEVMRMWRNGEIEFDKNEIVEELEVAGIDPDKAIHIVMGRDVEEVWNSDLLAECTFMYHYSSQGKLGSKDQYVDACLGKLEPVISGIWGDTVSRVTGSSAQDSVIVIDQRQEKIMSTDRSHLTKKPITDKNGKQTTVHVNDQKGDGSENASRLSSVSAPSGKKQLELDTRQKAFLDRCDDLGHDDFSRYSAKKSEEFEGTVQFSDISPNDYYKLVEGLEEDRGRSEVFPVGGVEGVLIDSSFVDATVKDEDGEEHEVSIYARETYENSQSSNYTVFVTTNEDTAEEWSNILSEELDRLEEDE